MVESKLGAHASRVRLRCTRRYEKRRGVAGRQPDQHERQRDDEPEQHQGRADPPNEHHRSHGWIMTARFVASIAATAFMGLIGCGPSPRPGDVVVYASGTDLESANPLVTIHPLSRQVQRYVLFVTLARYDSALAPQPYYARAWRWTADRKTLSLSLAPDLRWHDGTPTTSRDVVFTLQAARDPRIGFARAADL